MSTSLEEKKGKIIKTTDSEQTHQAHMQNILK
jgi:hypothetical protein